MAANVMSEQDRLCEMGRVELLRRIVKRSLLAGIVAWVLPAIVVATPALATVGWRIQSVADPTHFSPNDSEECNTLEKCDRYQLVVTNVGDTASSGTITVTDALPAGLTTTGINTSGRRPESENPGPKGGHWACSGTATQENIVTCTLSEPVAAGADAPTIQIPVKAPTTTSGSLKNEAIVKGGVTTTTPTAFTSEETEIGETPPPFEVTAFDFAGLDADGVPADAPGGHPDTLITNVSFPSLLKPPSEGNSFSPAQSVESVKDIVVELPLGFAGDPLATPRCPQYDLKSKLEIEEEMFERICSFDKSEVGIVAFDGAGSIRSTTERSVPLSPIYNVTPEAGYPAEFTFVYAGVAVTMYPSVVHSSSGYRLRVAVPGITANLSIVGASLAFFGDPAKRDKASGEPTAFLTNPADCTDGPLKAKVEADSWENPEHWVSRETTVYPQLENCDLLQFEPTLEMAPSPSGGEEGTSQADEPSAYSVDLKVPQKSLFEESATPELKGATVTLPQGVSVSPSAADGLAGCAEHGPHGIDIASNEGRAPDQAGEGEEIAPDGLAHLVAGHCPAASTLGTVEVITPLLEKPLAGHVFLASPKCGGEGQPACTEASATNGELYGLYLEAEGSGVVIKLAGSVSANPSTGQLTATFNENPQLPFSELKLHFHGGPRAPIANPQSCGSYATTSTLTSWAGQETPGTSPSFGIDWDGHGGACPATLPFNPGFTAGTTNPVGGAFSPFVLSFSRQDREQDLSGLTVTLPPGLLGKIAGVPLCGEGQANAGTCSAESQIGNASALAGPGEHPFYVSGGRVYLTTGYKGQPFGLSIVVPAVAGPFNLGDVVVRASIHIDQSTGQVTVTSDPLPQSRDGVPFRLRQVVTEITRSGFTFNPTNCSALQVTGTITGSQGAKASVSSPFAVTGCAGLPFKPSFTASTSGKTSKANGASFVVNVSQQAGEANIHKVDLQLPLALPARLTTLQKACTEAQFAANPAGCPEGSFIGTATAVTPVLPVPLTGPAILVSHGGAAFPDVEFVLQGDGVQIVLDGGTDIKKGITYSRFETVPDAPISSFVATLPEGPHSALAANGNLCSTTKTVTVKKRVTVRSHGHTRHVLKTVKKTVMTPLLAPTTITGQNGAQVVQTTHIAVTGCVKSKPKPAKRAKAKRKGGVKKK